MDLPPALLSCRLQPKTHCRPQKQRFGYPRLSKKIPRTPTKTDQSQGQFPKGQPTPCKTRDAFPRSPLGYRVLATHLLPLTSPVQLSPATKPAKFALTRKWAGPVMPLSRVPWPGSCPTEAVHFPGCSSATSADPQTFLLTPPSYSHSDSPSLH